MEIRPSLVHMNLKDVAKVTLGEPVFRPSLIDDQALFGQGLPNSLEVVRRAADFLNQRSTL